MDINVEQLPNRMQDEEEQAFRDFSMVFHRRLRGLFVHRGMSVAEAESLAVTCISDIALKVNRFVSRGPGSFEAWVLKLAHNEWIDECRAKPPVEALRPEEGVAWPPDPGESDYRPLSAVTSALVEAMSRLPATDRDVLRLRYFAGEYTYGEIAESLEITEGAARVRHHRAVKRLKSLLLENACIQAMINTNKDSQSVKENYHER